MSENGLFFSHVCFTGDILTGLGVAKYFDFILTSYKVKYAKPDPK